MDQPDELVFEALPQRTDGNKSKRRRKGAGLTAASERDADAAAAADGGQHKAATAAGGADLSTGFGIHDIEGHQQLEDDQQQQQQQLAGDVAEYRSAAVGEHKFEYLDHTADVQLHAWGSSLQEAFEQVGLAMFNYMTPIDALKENKDCTREVVARGHDLDSLLFSYLDELLFIYATEYIMFAAITITHMDLEGFNITATGRGEKFNRQRHECGTEVKAITYSAMQIRQAQHDAEVFVIVDI